MLKPELDAGWIGQNGEQAVRRAFIEWIQLPRSLRYSYDGWELNVWQYGTSDGAKWRFTAMRDGVYQGYGTDYPDADSACEAALAFARI